MLVDTAVSEAVALLRAGVDAVLSCDIAALDGIGVASLLAELETARRRLDAADTRTLAAAEDRRVAGDFAAASLADLLIERLHLDPTEARRRVRRCEELGPRRALTGEILPPILPATGGALTAGDISAAHADVIIRYTREVDLLPGAEPGDSEIAEDLLLAAAHHEPPRQVERLATALLARLDQDGTEPADERVARTRSFTLRRNPDGSSHWTVRADAELTALLDVLFDSLAGPGPRQAAASPADCRPAAGAAGDNLAAAEMGGAGCKDSRCDAAGAGIDAAAGRTGDPAAITTDGIGCTDRSDDRTATQRRHDAMRDALHRLLRSGDLPVAGGTPTTVIAHVRLDQLALTGRLDLDTFQWHGAPEVLDAVKAQISAQIHDARAAARDATSAWLRHEHHHTGGSHDTGGSHRDGGSDHAGGSDEDCDGDRRHGGEGHGCCDGYAVTNRGGLLSGQQLKITLCEAETDILVTSPEGAVLALGRSARLANRPQRIALTGRDGGCCFPGCTRPAAWCEAHHVIPWLNGGRTDVSNLCLLCPYHHRNFERLGWAVRMNRGVPEWIPPAWTDPQRRPARNTAHHLLEFEFSRR